MTSPDNFLFMVQIDEDKSDGFGNWSTSRSYIVPAEANSVFILKRFLVYFGGGPFKVIYFVLYSYICDLT